MIAQFALRLLLGMGLSWAVLPRRQITSGFFRIQLLLALGLSVLAAMTIGDTAPAETASSITANDTATPDSAFLASIGCGALATLAFLGSVLWTLERRKSGTLILFLLLAGACFLSAWRCLSPGDQTSLARIQRLLSELGAGGVLGSCVTAMLLGHWYLTAPTMSIAPLGRANAWFAATVLFRGVMAAWGLVRVSEQTLNSTHTLWLALRWSAGIALPLILCLMVARILRYRNTQSATGVLFAAVILIFLGELAGTLLSNELGVAL